VSGTHEESPKATFHRSRARWRLLLLIFSPWPLSHPSLVAWVGMGAIQSRRMPSRAWLRYAKERKKPAKGRSLKIAWSIFIVIGLPLGLLAILGPLAYSGIYIEPLRQFWRPWPSDLVKALLGVAGFAATAAYLTFQSGRDKGYHSGRVAGKADARNLAEGLGTLPVQLATVEPTPALPEPPVPPPQPPAM